jgi:DNA-binding SARP family transcriptional activator
MGCWGTRTIGWLTGGCCRATDRLLHAAVGWGRMEFRLLGPLEAGEVGGPAELGGTKQRALLAMLLLHANEVVSTERLIDGLWEEAPPRAIKAVQVYVSRLRKALGGTALTSRPPGYMLQVASEQLDLARFRHLREEARMDKASAAERLRQALALWRGPALDEFGVEPFARAERIRLEEERLEALEERIDAELGLGLHAALVGELEALVAAQPLRERLRGQLMLALYRCGRQADALATYRAGRRRLVEELGIEPSRALQQLERAILNQHVSLELVSAEVPAEASRGVFVGRRHEIDQLSEGLDDAFAGHGRLFLVAGEPGIGKSWLADALLARARARGARVLVGRCWEAGGAPAFWPWIQALRPHIRGADPDTLRAQVGSGASDLAPWFPELRELFPKLLERLPPESEGARFRLFEAVSSLLKATASSRPIVLFMDDLHAADEPSLLLLRFIVRELVESRLLVLGAYRDVDPTIRDPLSTALSDLTREPVTRRIELNGLAESEIAEYIWRSCSRSADPAVVEQVRAETEGNPLFVAELTGLLDRVGGLVDGSAPLRLGIPQGVRDVIGRRLRSLSVQSRRMLTMASVLGREFSVDALARLSGLPDGALLDLLDETAAARFIGEVPGAPGHLRFSHALFRDTIYQELTTPRRLQLHRQAGEALEAVYANNLEPHLSELVHHFASAGRVRDATKAVSYARRAGDRAAELLAFEEAARLYRVALDLVTANADTDRTTSCELLLALADVQARAGEMPEAQETFLKAAELATAIGSGELLARAALGFGGRLLYARATDGDQLIPLLTQAAEVLGPDDSSLRVRVLARHGNAVSQHLPEASVELTAEALTVARRLGDPATLAYAISARLYATRAPTDLDERWALTGELIHAADKERAFEGHAYRTIVLFAQGDIPGIRGELAAMTRFAEELCQASQRWWVAATGATLALLEGRFDDAEHLMEQARTLGEHAQGYDAVNFFQLQRFALRREQGRLGEVLTGLEKAAHADPTRAILRCALALALRELGRHEQAGHLLHQLAARNYAQLPVNNDWLLAAALLAELLALTADSERAKGLYRRLIPYDGLNVDTEEVSTGAVSRYLGLLAATARRYNQAARHFEDALTLNQSMGARSWFARTQHDYAQVLITRDQSGDRQRAGELLRQAFATYRELGIQAYARDTNAVGGGKRSRG